MAAYKFTIKRGKTGLADVVRTAGTAEAQTDTISVNIDATNLTKGEVLMHIDGIKAEISRGNWPI